VFLGACLPGCLTFVLIVAKLVGVLDVSWWVVTAPLWGLVEVALLCGATRLLLLTPWRRPGHREWSQR
jgi:hypothetical protein